MARNVLGRMVLPLRSRAEGEGNGTMSLDEVCRRASEMASRMETRVDDLRALHAPRDLLSRVVLAAEVMGRDLEQLLALAGAEQTDRPSGVQMNQPDLYAFALDNAIEGCLAESCRFVQTIDQSTDIDEVVNHRLTLMTDRALAHAELCWDIHEWCMGQLSPQRGRHIRAAQRDRVGVLSSSDGGQAAATLQGLARRIDKDHRAA